MANPILELIKSDGKFDPIKSAGLIVILIVLAWIFYRLFGKTELDTTSESYKKRAEKLEIITTNNAIPSTPISKVPLKALGVLGQNNKRRYLPGFDLEGADAPA